MEPLPPPDSMHLLAAQGWLELGDPSEAAADLNRVSAAGREHPDFLEMQWQLFVRNKQWLDALRVAEAICRLAPESPFGWIHRSYCLHELRRTQEAWDALLPTAERFPKEWLVCYNLACYACQLGWMDQARAWFRRALQRGDSREIERLAATDPDLKPMIQRQ